MPVNAANVIREFENVDVQRQSPSDIDVAGDYVVTVKNSGLVRIPNPKLKINNVSIAGETILSDEEKGLETISRDSEVSVKFSFETTLSDSESVANNICDGSVETRVKEKLEGVVLTLSFEDSAKLNVVSPSCNLEVEQSDDSTPSRPENGEAPELPEDEGGGDIPENPEMNIEGPEEVSVGDEEFWQITGDVINMTVNLDLGDGTQEEARAEIIATPAVVGGGPAPEPENKVVRHTYENSGSYTIVAEGVDDEGNVLATSTHDVFARSDGSGSEDDSTEDDPTNLEITGPDSVTTDEEAVYEREEVDTAVFDVQWDVSGGEVVSTSGENSTSATISFEASGQQEVSVSMQGDSPGMTAVMVEYSGSKEVEVAEFLI